MYRLFQASILKKSGIFARNLAATGAVIVLSLVTIEITTAQPASVSREYRQYDQPNSNNACAPSLVCDLGYSLEQCREKAVSSFGVGNFFLYRSSRILRGPGSLLAFGALLATTYEHAGCWGRVADATGRSSRATAQRNASIVIYSKTYDAFFKEADTLFWRNPESNKIWIRLFRAGKFHEGLGLRASKKTASDSARADYGIPEKKPVRPSPLPPTRRPPIAAPSFTPNPPADRPNQVSIIVFGPGYVESSDGVQVCRNNTNASGRGGATHCTFQVPKGTFRTYIARSFSGARFVRWNDDSSGSPSNVLTLPGKFDTRRAVVYFASPSVPGPEPVRRPKPGESVSD